MRNCLYSDPWVCILDSDVPLQHTCRPKDNAIREHLQYKANYVQLFRVKFSNKRLTLFLIFSENKVMPQIKELLVTALGTQKHKPFIFVSGTLFMLSYTDYLTLLHQQSLLTFHLFFRHEHQINHSLYMRYFPPSLLFLINYKYN